MTMKQKDNETDKRRRERERGTDRQFCLVNYKFYINILNYTA